ncbi:hypothetical protein [Blastococcus sp. CCUG 61487]|uniref:NACHT domain-containing protein n=1 Tax=Blastococcus sp. CCUG 61487 TaxID=1840703 RepID=UPI0010C06735|nr:hypothetical protein [Blastococcus sp. CCUG 61487]TKJ29883.1 hypothetical protein A6V29_19190 [Blastococcus sp. CCUG 61487]
MQYALNSLGPQQFEDMVRALCLHEFGPGATAYGRGRDGGREVAYNGELRMGSGETWTGRTVVQAKYRMEPRDPADNLAWLRNEMSKELKAWADPTSERRRKGHLPDNLIIATNVSLSSAAGGGIDAADAELKALAEQHGVPLRAWRVWPAQQITALLATARDVRLAFGGFLTPGDVLGQIAERLDLDDENLTGALTAHAVKEMLGSRYVALDAVGSDDDDRVSLGHVGVDLPGLTLVTVGNVSELKTVSTLDWLVGHADAVQQYRPDPHEPHALIIGGPGQGKTTLTALLAQTYRVALLDGSSALSSGAARLHAELSEQFRAAGLPTPRNRRWPIRVDLAAFAEFITSTGHASVLRYLAQRIAAESPHEISSSQLSRWLGRYPWLLLLDGLDEVASPNLRTQVLEAISGFLVDASAAGAADVVVVATTRPEGYADELDAADFAPVTLEQLTTDQALAYADRLESFRHPDNRDLQAHVRARLAEAAAMSMTARMMQSPLQVTIMCRLLERRQRVPQERYALFEAYFDAIYNREINKKGHISTLLEDRRRDVEWVHERVALTCQVEAETADGVNAAIPRSQLRELALQRLVREGIDEKEAGTMAARIADAALQRLVLLVPHGTGDSVGFEIRSLQEFLSARALATAADTEVLGRLRQLAPSAHWRNTWLFAAGHLFRTREWLRDSVLTLLREVDVTDELTEFAAPGAELAADLVQDGLAARSPDKNRALAMHALDDVQRAPGLGWPVLAETLLLAAEDEFTRSAIVRSTSAALAQGGGARATALLLCDWWRRRTGPLPAEARRLWLTQESRDDVRPGFIRLAPDRGEHGLRETMDRRRSVRDYLADLITDETEPARPFVELLGGRVVTAEPLNPVHDEELALDALTVPHAWVVHRGPRPDIQDIDDALITGDARHALRRLLDAVPPADWHVVSTVRADLQHWLGRRPVSNGLLRAVYP